MFQTKTFYYGTASHPMGERIDEWLNSFFDSQTPRAFKGCEIVGYAPIDGGVIITVSYWEQ